MHLKVALKLFLSVSLQRWDYVLATTKLNLFLDLTYFYFFLQNFKYKQAGDVWFLDSPEQSLGFILADHDFDVWVGNVRGTRWSHGHISLSDKDKVT